MLRLSSSTCSLHVVSRERRFSPNYYYVRERRGGECRGEEDGNGGRKNVVFAWRCCEKGRRGDSVPAVEQRCTSAPLLFSSSNLFWPGFWSRKCCSLGVFNTSMLTFLVEFFEVDHLGFVACFEIIKIFSIVPRRNRTRGKVTIVGRERSIETVHRSNTVLSRHQICLKIASFPVSRYCQFKWRFLREKALSCFPPHFGTRPNKMTQIQRFPVLSQFFPSFPR